MKDQLECPICERFSPLLANRFLGPISELVTVEATWETSQPPQGLSVLALQYNVFIHNVDKLISLNSQLLMTKGEWCGGGVSSSSLLISLNSQLLMTKGGGGEWGVLLLIAHVTSTLNS